MNIFPDPVLSGSPENNKEWFICLNVSKLDKETVHRDTDCGINIHCQHNKLFSNINKQLKV